MCAPGILGEQLRAPRKANTHISNARLTSTTKLDVKCNSCQLAKNTPPLSVIINVIASSVGRDLLVGPVMHERSLKNKKCVMQPLQLSEDIWYTACT